MFAALKFIILPIAVHSRPLSAILKLKMYNYVITITVIYECATWSLALRRQIRCVEGNGRGGVNYSERK
jgi:hypothetical protein